MFTGYGGCERRRVDLSGRTNDSSTNASTTHRIVACAVLSRRLDAIVARNDILEKARLMREAREQERKQESSSLIIQVCFEYVISQLSVLTPNAQSAYRSHRIRLLVKSAYRAQFDSEIQIHDSFDVQTIRRLLSLIASFYISELDFSRLLRVCEIVVSSFQQQGWCVWFEYSLCSSF